MRHEEPAGASEPGWSFLRSRRWLGYYALIIVFSIVCVFLGNWQFDRRDQAQAEITRIDHNYDAEPIPLTEALPTLDSYDNDAHKWQPVTMTGQYIGEPYLVRNRPGTQGVGSLLIHPFRTDTGDVFFIDRGWVPVNASDGIPEILPAPAEGLVQVTARLRQGEQPFEGREHLGRTLANIDLPELATYVDAPAYTGAYGQIIQETPAGETGDLPTRPERDEGPHLSYALQWYVFILIVIVGAWYAATLEFRSLNSGSERVTRDEQKKAARKLRRGPTDAEEEDAFLDSAVTRER